MLKRLERSMRAVVLDPLLTCAQTVPSVRSSIFRDLLQMLSRAPLVFTALRAPLVGDLKRFKSFRSSRELPGTVYLTSSPCEASVIHPLLTLFRNLGKARSRCLFSCQFFASYVPRLRWADPRRQWITCVSHGVFVRLGTLAFTWAAQSQGWQQLDCPPCAQPDAQPSREDRCEQRLTAHCHTPAWLSLPVVLRQGRLPSRPLGNRRTHSLWWPSGSACSSWSSLEGLRKDHLFC